MALSTPIGLRRAVGAPVPSSAPSSSAPVPVPVGFAPIFEGWNVWDIWQADDPTFSIMNVGLDLDRELRIWVENWIKDNAPGSAVADPANPGALRGDQIQSLPKVSGLSVVAARGDIPELAGAATLGAKGSGATLRTVRFWNRGAPGVMPWAHDENYLLDAVYQPSVTNPITNAPQPSSLAGTATAAASEVKTILTVVAIGTVAVVGVVLIASLVNSSRKAAA